MTILPFLKMIFKLLFLNISEMTIFFGTHLMNSGFNVLKIKKMCFRKNISK